jgi:DNA-binding NarL/FixJ family response regulator
MKRHLVEQPVRVLIVDDLSRSRDGLRTLLETWPEVEVVGEAVDGLAAILMVEKRQPDVVLMDARMPVLDGLEATRLIKHRWPEVRVIMFTMYANHRIKALNAGADAFLVKGCSADTLLETILDYGHPTSVQGDAPDTVQ